MSVNTNEVEQKVISSLLNYPEGMAFFIEHSYEVGQVFSTHKDLAHLIFQHHSNVRAMPTFTILSQLCSQHSKSDLLHEQLNDVKLTDPEEGQLKYYVDLLIEANRKQIVEKGLLSATDALSKGDVTLATKLLEKTSIESEDLVNRNLIKIGDLGADAKQRYKDFLEIKDNPDYYKRIPTGFKQLDDNIGGVGPGELNIMLGRPGHGKSMFLLNVGYNAWADYGKNVFFFSYEMPIVQVQRRLDARNARLDYYKIKNGDLSDMEIKLYEKKLKEMAQRKNVFKIIRPPQKTNVNVVRNEINKIIKTQGIKPDLVILDYMALMAPLRISKDQKETDRLGEIALDSRELASELQIPVWTACQINRPGAREKNVGTDNVFGSDQIAHHADMMLALRKNEDDLDHYTNTMEIQAVKVRDGACRNFEIHHDFSISLMCDKVVEGFNATQL